MEASRSKSGFRSDINGMRAIAVVGVIAFHFKLGPLRAGGFAGVDVFFVVSGFLMTQIIVGRLHSASFSLRDFLMARTRRIVPAFVVLVVGVIIAGIVLLNPLQLEAQARRAVWSLFFLSNFLFAKESSYFNAPEHNWLLHTWSLSVEWQFYLLFPIMLLLLRKMNAARPLEVGVLVAAAFVSFGVMIWSLSAGGDSRIWNFYMLSSRAWEFLAGALCAYAVKQVVLGPTFRMVTHYSGMAAIFLAMLIFHNTTPWPSLATLLPVAGVAGMLVAGHEHPAWARFAPTRFLGVWSYSVYLWHWPVAAILSFFGDWSLLFRLAGVAASLLLGIWSYLLVERRATDYLWRERRRTWQFGFSGFCIALVFTVLASETNGFEAVRYGLRPSLLAKLRDFRTARYDWLEGDFCDHDRSASPYVDECRFGNLHSDDVLVVGDSFAAQLTPRYKSAFKSTGFGLTFATRGACVPISKTTYTEYDATCDQWTEELYPYILKSKFQRVVFIAFWPMYTQGRLCLLTEPNCGSDLDTKAYNVALDAAYRRLAELWKRLREQGKEVVVFDVVPYPGLSGDPLKLYERVARGEPTESIEISYDAFMKRHAAATARLEAATRYADVTLVDPARSLCPEGRCPIVKQGRPLYKDAFHLRASMMKDARFAIFDRYIVPPLAEVSGPMTAADRPTH